MDYNNLDNNMTRINQNRDFFDIAHYIIEEFSVDMDIIDAKKISEYLVYNLGFTKSEILNGMADADIYENIRSYVMKTNSVSKKSEPVIGTKLKTKKTLINKKTVSLLLAVTLGVSSLSVISKSAIDDYKENKEIDDTISMMASEGADYKTNQNIVDQNTYRAGQDSRGFPNFAYHNDGIAEDIIKVCTQNPEMFDLCLHNVYFDMSYNRLENMDNVLRYLQIFTKNDEALSGIYNKIANYKVFLDYIVDRGFLDPNDKNYYNILDDIAKYKELKSTTEYAFNSLSDESQKRIEGLIANYEDNKDNLYEKYKNTVEYRDGVDFGSR